MEKIKQLIYNTEIRWNDLKETLNDSTGLLLDWQTDWSNIILDLGITIGHLTMAENLIWDYLEPYLSKTKIENILKPITQLEKEIYDYHYIEKLFKKKGKNENFY